MGFFLLIFKRTSTGYLHDVVTCRSRRWLVVTEAAKRRGKYIPPLTNNTEVNNCFSIYENSEITEHKNDDFFNSFTVANDYNFGAQ